MSKHIKEYAVYNPYTRTIIKMKLCIYPNESLLYISHKIIIKSNKRSIYLKTYIDGYYTPWKKISLSSEILSIDKNQIYQDRVNNKFQEKRF